ncbi:peptidylprolyl isomerase [Pontixanthobacter gangjinensis]|uniref:peptidylprolyl isomerase n=1 Tax=Pontixanthobacter gangjinensis TaxID=1028742 RepID=A0A6I4SME4_9SPHN|nr:peptidylprolyl isomerase [Pontixanthobacter gangjinensis]MXO56290.1 peptidylprolyl isomerase [Pontixanthobacter gangjinensis]
MKKHCLLAAVAVALTFPAAAQDAEPEGPPSPGQIVAGAPASEWVSITAEDLLVMTLAPDAEGNARQVVIQLMPAPFSQGWVSNIRTFARAEWYDNISVNRVQDNYVVQWGDPNYDNPEATGETKVLPEGLKVMEEEEYTSSLFEWQDRNAERDAERQSRKATEAVLQPVETEPYPAWHSRDAYAPRVDFYSGWPAATSGYSWNQVWWPVHCYGMIGVGRNYSPDTGSGAELYTVIGHAPRHLDRNIALVGRIIEGMEHLSSLPRGKGELGFYREDEFDKRTPILSVRVASDLPAENRPAFEYLSTEGETFAKYADARANRRDPFFIAPAGGADICNIPVPVRRVSASE